MQQMFNFLDPRLMPKVKSSCSVTENYEADNLIDPNETVRARGFLAYTVTKPPVEIDFEFLCPMEIAYLELNSSIGQQKCSGIEVFVKTSNSPFLSIAKAVFDSSSVIFCNSRRFSKQKPPPTFSEDKGLFYFKSDMFRVFSNASGLRILIFRTFRNSVPCLGAVRVFGKPSRTCSTTTVNTLMRLMGVTKVIPENVKKCDQNSSQKIRDVPADFLDALTCELMTLPMTLPSGKTVDKDTLEKHIDNEKSFGRKPGDPFTGLLFNGSRKAVLNVALKSRIDMFLMQRSHDPSFFSVKRTLGSSHDENAKISRKRLKQNGKCGVCSENETLYIIPCQHLYCKACLLNIENVCRSCGKQFSKTQAERCFTD